MSYTNNTTNNTTTNTPVADIPLSNLIRDIIFAYMEFYYKKYLKENNLLRMDDSDIDNFIDNYIVDKDKELKNYIRNSLKENLKEKYNGVITNNIIDEIFSDLDLAKERLKVEILDYQDN